MRTDRWNARRLAGRVKAALFGTKPPEDPAIDVDPAEAFDNRQFWDARYRTDPELGSGPGSRGEFVEQKRNLMVRAIDEFDPGSILDVGCGDIEVTKDLPFSGHYTGIDLSPTVVARNRRSRPDWTFLDGDFLELLSREQLVADLVLCFDVLIHQHDYATYRAFVRGLVDAAQTAAIFNGFEEPRGMRRRRKITAYHEPLTRTLEDLGVTGATIVGPFRHSLVVQVDKRGS